MHWRSRIAISFRPQMARLITMRTGRYLVMRYAVILGYSSGRRWISVATRADTVDDAIAAAVRLHQRSPDAAYWISAVGARCWESRNRMSAYRREP